MAGKAQTLIYYMILLSHIHGALSQGQADDCTTRNQTIGCFGQGDPRSAGTDFAKSGPYSMVDIDGAAQMPAGILTSVEYRASNFESFMFQVWRPADLKKGKMKLIFQLRIEPNAVEEVCTVHLVSYGYIVVAEKDRWGFSYSGNDTAPIKYSLTYNVPNNEPYHALECDGCAADVNTGDEVIFPPESDQKQFRIRVCMVQVVTDCPNAQPPAPTSSTAATSPVTSATWSVISSASTRLWDVSTTRDNTVPNDPTGPSEPPSTLMTLVITISVGAVFLCSAISVFLMIIWKQRRTIQHLKKQKYLHTPPFTSPANQSSTNDAYKSGNFTIRTTSYQHYDKVKEPDETTVYIDTVSEQYTENSVHSNTQLQGTVHKQTPKIESDLRYERPKHVETNASVQGYAELKDLSCPSSPTDCEKPDILLEPRNKYALAPSLSPASSSGYEKPLIQTQPPLHNDTSHKDSHGNKANLLVISTSAAHPKTATTGVGCHSSSIGDRGYEMPQVIQDHAPPQSPQYTKLASDYE